MAKHMLGSKASMSAAVDSILKENKGLREAARLYNIPMAYTIIEKNQRKHPFQNGTAGRAWFQGFMRRHPNLTVRSPQPLSYCRALCSNHETLDEFLESWGQFMDV